MSSLLTSCADWVLLGSLSQASRRRFQVPDSAVTIADRITLQCHHDWIEAFLVSHGAEDP